MNIGNLIKSKINTSSFNNMKELYEAMKDIIGDSCCAYNTFTDSLNKNKELSASELLTLSVLLEIDLNTIAMHYVNTQSNLKSDKFTAEDYNRLEKNIVDVLNILSFNIGRKCEFNRSDITIINNKVCAVSMDNRGDSILAYEITVKRQSSDYVFKINTVANLNYFKSILHNNGFNVCEFKELNLLDKFNFIKKESRTYYEIFPELKEEISISFEEFRENVLIENIKEYLKNTSKLYLTTKGEIYEKSKYSSILTEYELRRIIVDYIDEKYNRLSFITQDANHIGNLFKKIAPNILKYYISEFELLRVFKSAIECNLNKNTSVGEDYIFIEDIHIGDVFKSAVVDEAEKNETYYTLKNVKIDEEDEIGHFLLIKCDEKGKYDCLELKEYEDLEKYLINNPDGLDKLVTKLKLTPVYL